MMQGGRDGRPLSLPLPLRTGLRGCRTSSPSFQGGALMPGMPSLNFWDLEQDPSRTTGQSPSQGMTPSCPARQCASRLCHPGSRRIWLHCGCRTLMDRSPGLGTRSGSSGRSSRHFRTLCHEHQEDGAGTGHGVATCGKSTRFCQSRWRARPCAGPARSPRRGLAIVRRQASSAWREPWICHWPRPRTEHAFR